MLLQALGMLRYTLHTHLEYDFVCTDGEEGPGLVEAIAKLKSNDFLN